MCVYGAGNGVTIREGVPPRETMLGGDIRFLKLIILI